MKYFTGKIESGLEIEQILKSLKSMLYVPTNDFFVFPFCLFQKRFYSNLRNNKDSVFIGKVNRNDFEFNRSIRYGNVSTGSRIRELRIKGDIKENGKSKEIVLEFHSPQFEIIIETIIIIGCLIFLFTTNNYLFIVLPILILLDRIYMTFKYYNKIRKQIKNVL